MTSPESPSSLLERAADLIENLACGATAGTWSVDDLGPSGHPGVWWVDFKQVDDGGTLTGNVAECETMNSRADAAWIATLNPSVATPLVAWLRRAASYFTPDGPLTDEEADTDPYAGPAMQFARLALGEGA